MGKIQREGAGAIQKEGVGEIPKEGEGSGMGKGMRGSKRKCLATPLPTPTRYSAGSMQEGSPQIAWRVHKSQDASPDHAPCRRHGRTDEQTE